VITDFAGMISVVSDWSEDTLFTFCITDVIKDGYVYDKLNTCDTTE